MTGQLPNLNRGQPSAASAVQESEERFRLLWQHAPVGIYFSDADGAIRQVNQRCCEISGRPVEQLIKAGWRDSIHPEDAADVMAAFAEVIQTRGTFFADFRICLPDGRVRWVQSQAKPMHDGDGQFAGWIGTVLDVTEQTEAVRALRASREQYRELFNANTDGLFFTALDGALVDVNPAAAEMHGYTREEFLQLRAPEFIHADSLHHFNGFLAAAREGRLFHCEAYDFRRDGAVFPVEVYGTQMHYLGEPHAFAIVRDITARKAAEQKLKQQELMLAHVSRLSTMGEMAAGIAHELNQPMYTIVNLAKALGNTLANHEPPDLDKAGDLCEDIAQAAAKAGEMVRRYRAFGGRGRAERRLADINTIVRDSVQLLQYELRRMDVSIEFKLADEVPPVFVDDVQIQQVMVNLIKNAIEAMHATPAKSRRITIVSEVCAEDLLVSVADAGEGLAPNMQGTLFEPFASDKPDGTGLGLAISRTIVQAHDGEISAATSPSGGVTIQFNIPLSNRAENAGPCNAPPLE